MKKNLLILSTLIIFTLSIIIIIFFSYEKKNVSYALKVPESLAIYLYNEETKKHDIKVSKVPHGYELNKTESYCESGGEVINYNAYEEYVNYALATGDKCHLYFDRYLPEGYTKLEYIESTGTQYINTGVQNSTSAAFDVEMDVMYTTTDVANQIMGFTGNRGQGIGPGYNYFWESELSEGSGSYNEATVSGIIYNLKWGKKANTYYRIYNGKGYAGIQGNTTAFTTNMLLFAAYLTANSTTVDYLCHAKLYYAKIKKDGALIRDFVPALNSQGEAGLYDRVEKKFYANAGTGQFKYEISGDELPPEYTQLEYLESTGTQYIDTGWKASGMDFSVSSGFMIIGDAVDQTIFGADEGGLTLNMMVNPSNNQIFQFGINNWHNSGVHSLAQQYVYIDTAIKSSSGLQTFYANGEQVSTPASNETSLSLSHTIGLFTNHKGSSAANSYYATGRMYYFKVVESGKLVRNMIPALNKDGIPGMYDTVEGKFYTNAGTGQFKYSVNNNRLPSGYTPVRYIESSGTQYIDTGVSPTSNMEVEIAFTPTGGLQENAIFGSSWSASGYFLMFYNNQIRWHSGGSWVDIGSYSAGDKVQCYATNSYIMVNGTKYNIAGGSNSSNNIVLLGDMGYNSSKKGIGKIEYVKMWDNGVLVRDLVPCINPYGEVGLYDVVNNKFYGNSGSGTFKAGAPSEYTTLNYIEATGTQYIDTGYSAPNGFYAEADFTYNAISGGYIVGSHNTSEPWGRNGFGNAGGQYWELGIGDSCPSSSATLSANTRYLLEGSTVKGQSYMNVNGSSVIGTNTDSTSRSSLNLWVFYLQYSQYYGYAGNSAKLYSLKIWDEKHQLVRVFIPAKNASGTIGLYDALSGNFYTNAGSGTFASG